MSDPSARPPAQQAAVAPPADNFLAYVKAFGPGIVVALSWVGTGDLIDNSVAGGNYGYALLWVPALQRAAGPAAR
ncbi:hypothetical protein [Pseudonocardia nigra]|uniref:hypothetical protein n=1 Tax=Pseudonocardia nigra TaxID=1921578 RepID=UPI001C5EFB84|nr:hypothetical protein [Pseudonocardia nigra]